MVLVAVPSSNVMVAGLLPSTLMEELRTTYEAMPLLELLAMQNQYLARGIDRSTNRLDIIDCSLLEAAIRRKMK